MLMISDMLEMADGEGTITRSGLTGCTVLGTPSTVQEVNPRRLRGGRGQGGVDGTAMRVGHSTAMRPCAGSGS